MWLLISNGNVKYKLIIIRNRYKALKCIFIHRVYKQRNIFKFVLYKYSLPSEVSMCIIYFEAIINYNNIIISNYTFVNYGKFVFKF